MEAQRGEEAHRESNGGGRGVWVGSEGMGRWRWRLEVEKQGAVIENRAKQRRNMKLEVPTVAGEYNRAYGRVGDEVWGARTRYRGGGEL